MERETMSGWLESHLPGVVLVGRNRQPHARAWWDNVLWSCGKDVSKEDDLNTVTFRLTG